jgi:hypothetical protein
MMVATCVGTIVRLQVQTASLKVEGKPRRYDPAPLRVVPALRVTSGGVTGLADDGTTVADVHHADHPRSKNRQGTNGISLGFTAHYTAMRARFGDHLVDGIAGENILIEVSRRFEEDDLARGLVIEDGDGARLVLRPISVAAPCVEFARFAVRIPADVRSDTSVTEALRFLDGGMRGFYAVATGEPAQVRPGARVFLP